MKRLVLLVALLLAFPLQAAETRAAVLYYRITEPGIAPYLSRWLISGKFLRIDEGDAADNYVLFNRESKTVHSVVHGDRTVLDIPARPVGKIPAKELLLESRSVRNDKFPAVEGKQPLYRELYVNGALCYSTVSVAEVLPEVVKVLREYRQVMAGEHAKNIDNTPVELQQPCELSLHIFNPVWRLEQGLPIQEWDPQGKAQVLLDYKSAEAVDDALFTLPQGYRHYQTQESP